jgi:hypothetical protein
MKTKHILTLAEVDELLIAARNEAAKNKLSGRDRCG